MFFSMHSVAEGRTFLIWLRGIWLRNLIWLRFGYEIQRYGYDLVTHTQIWLRFGYATIWLRFGYDLVTI